MDQEANPDRPRTVGLHPKSRSAIANGSRLFPAEVNGRTAEFRRFRDVLAEIISDLGGAEVLSEGERQIARRCAALSVEAERMEAGLVGEGEFDLESYATLTNALGRALARIGLRRRTRDVTPPLLHEYIAGQAGGAE